MRTIHTQITLIMKKKSNKSLTNSLSNPHYPLRLRRSPRKRKPTLYLSMQRKSLEAVISPILRLSREDLRQKNSRRRNSTLILWRILLPLVIKTTRIARKSLNRLKKLNNHLHNSNSQLKSLLRKRRNPKSLKSNRRKKNLRPFLENLRAIAKQNRKVRKRKKRRKLKRQRENKRNNRKMKSQPKNPKRKKSSLLNNSLSASNIFMI